MKKKSSKGVKFLSLYIILMFGFALFSSFGAENFMKSYNDLSDETKLKMLESSKVKTKGAESLTVEELDESVRDQMNKMTSDWKYLTFYGFMVITGIGLWMLMNWARITIILVSSFRIVMGLISFSIGNLISLSVFVLIIFFLTRPKVKEQFKKEKSDGSIPQTQ